MLGEQGLSRGLHDFKFSDKHASFLRVDLFLLGLGLILGKN